MGPDDLLVLYLQFADDTLVICRNSPNQIRHLRCIMRCFELVPGLQVTLSKSCIYGVGQVLNLRMLADGQVLNLRRLADILGCQIDSLPSSYLGLPLSAFYKHREPWNHVISQIQRKFAGWKGIYLSKGGKITLLKSILAGFPTYSLSLWFSPFGGGCH